MTGPNYTALVSAARGGNSNAIEALYNTTFQGVYYTAQKLTGNAHDAEEMAQETYIKIFSSLDQIQNPEVFPAWANRIAANVCCSYLRKSRPVLFATDEQEELTLGSIPETDEAFLPAEFVQSQDKREKLIEAINDLPEKQRAAIYMHYFSEMPVKDIAAELGVNENTVKSRLNAGRTTIRTKLEKLGITSAAVMALTAALKVDSQAALLPAASKATVWAGVSSTAAAAASAAATTTTAAVAAGTAASAGTAATAAAVTVKAGLFASLGAKIAAGVLAGVVAISGGAAIVATTIRGNSTKGIPAEMQVLVESVDKNDYYYEDLVDALRHDFGEVEETFEFEDLAVVERYADNYAKVYLTAELLESIETEDYESYFKLLGDEWNTNAHIHYPFTFGLDRDETIKYASAFQDDGSVVIYQFSNEDGVASGEPLELIIRAEDDEEDVYVHLTRKGAGIPIPEEMALLSELIDEENYEADELFLFLNHNFDRIAAEYTFSDGARVEQYTDGWCKLYIDEDLLDRMDDVTFLEVTGESWYSPISHDASYDHMRNMAGDQEVMSACCVQNGQAVYYFRPLEDWQITTDGVATAITFFDEDKTELFWICADGVSEEEADAQRGTPEDKANRSQKLSALLDFSKAWTATEQLQGTSENHTIIFVFQEDGSCACLFGIERSDIYAVYHGNYVENDGRVTFTFNVDGVGTLEYTFLITPQAEGVLLVQESAEGFYNYHKAGHVLDLNEDEFNDAAAYQEMADNYIPYEEW